MTAEPWLKAFLLTLAIELPIVVPLLRAAEAGLARRVALAFFANLATHPVVWFVFPGIPIDGYTSLVLSEIWAFITEAAFLVLVVRGLSIVRASLASLIANAGSCAAGLLLVRWFGRWLLE
ncbi:MAG: hypothetical protein HY907_09750 [Deltaproteobacteria bacterium]|nr:hypothetical protein [Deltaproteobacteria bacterium]